MSRCGQKVNFVTKPSLFVNLLNEEKKNVFECFHNDSKQEWQTFHDREQTTIFLNYQEKITQIKQNRRYKFQLEKLKEKNYKGNYKKHIYQLMPYPCTVRAPL